ncbi:unnamed protein product [Urochloa humidicola]
MSSSTSSDHHLPSPGARWRRRLRDTLSTTSVRVRADTTTHLLHVGRYSRVDGKVCPGECIESEVRAGGRRWMLSYYPNGDSEERRGRACSRLMLVDNLFGTRATAEYRLSILGRSGEPACTRAFGPRRYVGDRREEVEVIATAEEQSKAMRLAEDDSLVVRCDLTVLNAVRESRVKWYLRSLWKS